MKLSAAIALIATASAVRLMDDDERTKELVERTLDAETLEDLGDLTLEDLGEEGGECLLFSTGLTLLEHGVPEEIVAEVGEHMIAGAESGAPLSEGIEALRKLGEAYEADAEEQDKVLGDILGKVQGCAAAAKKEWEGEEGDDDEGDDEKSSGTDLEEEEVSEIEEDDEDKSCYDDECSSGTDLAAELAQKGKLRAKVEDKAEEGDDEEEDEDKEEDEEEEGDDEKSSGTDLDGEGEEEKPDELADDDEDDEDKDEEEEEEDDGEEPEYEEKSEIEEDDEEKTCADGECSSGTDLALAQIRDEAADIVDELAASVEALIEEADLDEEDLEKALEHVAGKLEEADVDGAKVEELGALLESGDFEALEEEVAALSEDARAALMEAAEDIAGEIERKLGEKADDFADFKSEAGKELEAKLDLDDGDDDDE